MAWLPSICFVGLLSHSAFTGVSALPLPAASMQKEIGQKENDEVTSVNDVNMSGKSRFHLMVSMLETESSVDKSKTPAFPCNVYPNLCEPPFNCHQANLLEEIPFVLNGHANLKAWCMLPSYASQVIAGCYNKHDILGTSMTLFDIAISSHVDELEGSNCFLEGHCTNEEVTDDTTPEEAEKMCDNRFGPLGWRGNFMPDLMVAQIATVGLSMRLEPAFDLLNGFHEQKLTKLLTKMSCAMGSYHCDIQHCKHTFCRNRYYINKYAHLLPHTPGHLIRDWF